MYRVTAAGARAAAAAGARGSGTARDAKDSVSVTLLKLVVWLLPRSDWSRAMLAELAALDDRRARRRFALGCVRAVLMPPASGLRVGAIAVVCAVPALLLSGPGGSGDRAGPVIAGLFVVCLVTVDPRIPDLPSGGTPGGRRWNGLVDRHPHERDRARTPAVGAGRTVRVPARRGLAGRH